MLWILRIPFYLLAAYLSLVLLPLDGVVKLIVSALLAAGAIVLETKLSALLRQRSFEEEISRRVLFIDHLLAKEGESLAETMDRSQIEGDTLTPELVEDTDDEKSEDPQQLPWRIDD